jgi:selenocysteine lyase/cysteine desulfurase
LTRYALHKLKDIPGVIIYGSVDEDEAHKRLGVISFNIQNKPHALVSAILNYEGGIGVRSGCFCAHPYIKCLLDVSVEEIRVFEQKILQHDRSMVPGAIRMSFGMYNSKEEIDRFVEVLEMIATNQYQGTYHQCTETGEYCPVDFKITFEDYFRL